MIHLLDVDVLMALVWPSHVNHTKAVAWRRGKSLALCPITELGFVRVSTGPFNTKMADARQVGGLKFNSGRPGHRSRGLGERFYLPKGSGCRSFRRMAFGIPKSSKPARPGLPGNGKPAKKRFSPNGEAFDLPGALAALREFDGALLANTIGYIDPAPAHEYYMGGSIQSVTPAIGPTVGVAVTCEMDASTPGQTGNLDGFWQQLDEIKALGTPVVWVVKAVGSRPDHECIAGDGMGKSLASVGCVGIVTDGGVRDVKGFLGIPLAVYSKGITIHHTPLRIRRINQPVEVGGIIVHPGDIIHASAEGVIKVPRSCLGTLPGKAMDMWAFEREAHLVFACKDLSASEKKRRVLGILAAHGFAAPSDGKRERQMIP
jgi:4-hydroxy-4-methyl-2-oxoglutarate aldolase